MHKVALAALAVACLAESGMAANCAAPKKGQRMTLSQADIDTILERHNYERDLLTKEGFMDIKFMKWHPTLQQTAENLAGACVFAHSSSNCRSQTGMGYFGENLAATSPGAQGLHADIYKMCNMWNAEKADYNKNSGKCNPGAVCGHYTQVVWPSSEFVGCAVTKCQSGILSMPSFDIRCVYSAGGNFGGEKATHKASGACLTPNKCGKPEEGHCGITGSGYFCDCHAGYDHIDGKPTGKCVASGNSQAVCKNAADCNNHGSCSSTGKQCNCNGAWAGVHCEKPASSCKAGTASCLHGTCDTNGQCKCAAGYSGNSCAIQTDLCNGFCKHGTCQEANHVATCTQCDSGWQGNRCDTPAGGAWVPKLQVWKDVDKEVTNKRLNYGRTAIPLRSGDRTDAIKEANKCDNSYHADTEVDSHGYHTWGMMLCMDLPESKFTPYGTWLGGSVIAGMSKFATSMYTTGYACAISAKPCPPVAGYCGGQKYRMLACKYELKIGHNKPELDENVFVDEATPPRTQEAGSSSFVAPVLAAVCVALAAVVVVLAAKVRRANQAPAEYNEMA